MYILTFSHLNYIDNACRKIISNINLDNPYHIVNIDVSSYYGAIFFPQENKHDINIVLPNLTAKKNIWQTPLTEKELQSVLNILWDTLENIYSKFLPKAALIADDRGNFEKLFILFCNIKDIPVIHWVHGEEFTRLESWHTDDALPSNTKKNCIFNATKNILPKGFNGRQYICVNSSLDKIKLLYHGIMPQQIVVTGNPTP